MTTENFLLSAIKWLLILTLFTPLIVSGSTLFPYVMGKAIAFQVLVELTLICYIWLLYFNRKKTGRFNFLPERNLLAWSLLIFFAVLVLNNIFSVDPYNSFWSKQERMEGLFNLFHFFAFFFIIASTIKSKSDWLKILNVSLAVSFIITLYAFGQKFGWFFNPYGDRVTGTLGNSAFLGTYLLFNIFFSIYLFFIFAKEYWQKILYIAAAAFELVALILTQTRGAIYGLVAGIILFSVGYIFLGGKKETKKYALATLIIIIIAASGLFAARNANFVKNNRILYRLTDVSFQAGTGKIRLTSWKIGFDAFLEKPIFGWGEENYYVAFNKHIDPVFFSYSGETFDRAHNKMVDLLVMNGLLGFTAYIMVFGAALWLLWKKRKEITLASIILIALLGSYFLQNFMLFDMPTSYLMFFLSLGLVAYSVADATTATNQTNVPLQKRNKQNKAFFGYIAWLLTFIFILTLWNGNLKPLSASQKSIEGQQIFSAKNKTDNLFKAGLDKFKESTEKKVFTNPETRKTMSQVVLSTNEITQYSSQVKLDGFKFTASQLEQGINEMPYFLDYYLNLADIYNTLGAQDQTYYSKAESAIDKAIELYPNVPYIYYKLAVNRLVVGDYAKAVETSQKALALNSNLAQSNWYLGVSQFYAGNIEAAKEATQKALELGYSYSNNPSSIYYLSQLSEKLKDYDMAIKSYEEILRLRPTDYEIQFALAKMYKEKGNIDKAKELVQQVVKSAPEAKAQEAAEFLVSLGGMDGVLK